MTIGYWLYGKTGAGKSRWAAQNFPEAYWKPSLDKWFDGYMMEQTVIIDDYRPTQDLSFEYLLRLVDRYPLMVQTKGAFVPFVPKRIIITSPRDISETFLHLNHQEDMEQLTRRFPHRLCFDHGTIPHYLQYEPDDTGGHDSVGPPLRRRRTSEETNQANPLGDFREQSSNPELRALYDNDAGIPDYCEALYPEIVDALLELGSYPPTRCLDTRGSTPDLTEAVGSVIDETD